MYNNHIRLTLGLIAIMALLTMTPHSTQALVDVTPIRLRIASINLNQRISSVGLDNQRWPIVPKHSVGWYDHSARPGTSDNVVMWGHVLRWKASPAIPAAFERLSEIKLGAVIDVLTSDRKVHRYKVTRKLLVHPSDVAFILPTGNAQLTLVSCYGENVVVNGEISKEFRLITVAVPIP